MKLLPVPTTAVLDPLLYESSQRHKHLCPRQVLGVRMGLYGLRQLGFSDVEYQFRFDNAQKRLLTIMETDGCGADGVAVATACYVGRRTLRVLDYGKMACTLVDTLTSKAMRITPHPQARTLAGQYAPQAPNRWHAYLAAYQLIPDELLLQARKVQLTQSVAQILSRPDVRVLCDRCGEEIINEREVVGNGRILCQSCAGDSYYQLL